MRVKNGVRGWWEDSHSLPHDAHPPVAAQRNGRGGGEVRDERMSTGKEAWGGGESEGVSKGRGPRGRGSVTEVSVRGEGA